MYSVHVLEARAPRYKGHLVFVDMPDYGSQSRCGDRLSRASPHVELCCYPPPEDIFGPPIGTAKHTTGATCACAVSKYSAFTE